jgi:hypothetical protein
VKEGREQARAAAKHPDLKNLHPDLNLKLFEPVATPSCAEALRLTGITVANRP